MSLSVFEEFEEEARRAQRLMAKLRLKERKKAAGIKVKRVRTPKQLEFVLKPREYPRPPIVLDPVQVFIDSLSSSRR